MALYQKCPPDFSVSSWHDANVRTRHTYQQIRSFLSQHYRPSERRRAFSLATMTLMEQWWIGSLRDWENFETPTRLTTPPSEAWHFVTSRATLLCTIAYLLNTHKFAALTGNFGI